MKVNKVVSIFFIILLTALIYKAYWKQREKILENLTFPLSLACDRMIQSAFSQHATDIRTKNVGYHELHKTISQFDFFNNLIYFHSRYSAGIYFKDYAPQDLYCSVYIVSPEHALNMDTKVKFTFLLPRYLPPNEKYYLKERELTFRQVGKLNRLPHSFFNEKQIEKPSLMREILASLLDSIDKLLK